MAIDTALACSYRGVPILRVYGWKPPAISLGFHQRLNDLDLEKCSRDGIDVVYRPTGGRAGEKAPLQSGLTRGCA